MAIIELGTDSNGRRSYVRHWIEEGEYITRKMFSDVAKGGSVVVVEPGSINLAGDVDLAKVVQVLTKDAVTEGNGAKYRTTTRLTEPSYDELTQASYVAGDFDESAPKAKASVARYGLKEAE